jgi:hypothetical protein
MLRRIAPFFRIVLAIRCLTVARASFASSLSPLGKLAADRSR